MNSKPPTYFHYRSGGGTRNSLTTKHFSDKIVKHSDTNVEKLLGGSNPVPEPLPRQSRLNSFSNKTNMIRSRSCSADLEDLKNGLNSPKDVTEIRTLDRLQNYRLEKNFVTYTEQPANGFNGVFYSDEDLSPKNGLSDGNLDISTLSQASPQFSSSLRRTIQVRSNVTTSPQPDLNLGVP